MTTSAKSVIQPSHANASIAVRMRHAWNWEQNDGRFGQMDWREGVSQGARSDALKSGVTHCRDGCTDEPEDEEDHEPKQLMPHFREVPILAPAMDHVYPKAKED